MLLAPEGRTAVIAVFNTTNSVRGRESQAGFEAVVRAALALAGN